MATYNTPDFQYVLNGDTKNFPSNTQPGVDTYEFSINNPIAAGDNIILDWIRPNVDYLPEQGSLISDGSAGALTVQLGHGTYDKVSGTLTVTDADSLMKTTGDLATAGRYEMVHSSSIPVGALAATRVGSTASNAVLILNVVSETTADDAPLVITLPYRDSSV